MARRFGGRYSPGGDTPDWHARRPARVGARANILFFLPIPFIVSAFTGNTANLALKLATVALMLAAAWLTREGLRAEDAWDARPVARRPALPRKTLGAAAMGLGLGLAGLGGGSFDPLIFAVLGAGLHLAAFGPDPMRDKGLEGMDAAQTARVARAVDEAEGHLQAMTAAIRRLGDRALAERVARFQHGVRAMIRALESDPRGLVAARRYLGVYLLGARDATLRFADLYPRREDRTELRRDYEALLEDLERNFAARTAALSAGDRTALDIEIEVLRERLAREGLRPENG